MYRSGPPLPAGAEPGARPGPGLRVRRAVRRGFDGTSASSLDPDLRVYLTDMIRPYQLALREEMLKESVGHNYGEMTEELMRSVVSDDEPIDLLLLVFAIPDVRPGRSSVLYLSSICPGRPMAFAITEQGAAAAHTALKLAHAYGRGTDPGWRAVVLIVEQAALHYEPAPTPDGGPAVVPDRHTAVALVCDHAGTEDNVSVHQHADVGPDAARDLLAAEIAGLGADQARTVVILGSGLAGAGLVEETSPCRRKISAPAGEPFTGQWSELTRGLPEWTADGANILIADYDAQLRCLSFCSIDTAAVAPDEDERSCLLAAGSTA